MARIFLFRHGQSVDNAANVFSGKRDPDLTEEGVKEAQVIRDALKDVNVTHAFCSDLLRSRRTLEIVLEPHKDAEPIVDVRLRERDYGELTGQNKDEVAKKYPDLYPLWHRSYDTPPPGGESLMDVERRVVSFLKDLFSITSGTDVIFISASGNSLRPIRRYFEKMTPVEMSTFEHEPAKVYEYQI